MTLFLSWVAGYFKVPVVMAVSCETMTLEAKDDTANPHRKRIIECPYCDAEIGKGCALKAHLPCDGVSS